MLDFAEPGKWRRYKNKREVGKKASGKSVRKQMAQSPRLSLLSKVPMQVLILMSDVSLIMKLNIAKCLLVSL